MGTTYNTNVVSDGLIACWDAANRKSYPGTGTTWTDLVNGNNGALTNMDTGGFDSANGGVIEFDGTNEYIDLGSITSSNPLMCAGGPLSICAWFYDDSGDGSSSYTFLISKGSSDGSDGYAIYVDYTRRIQVTADSDWSGTALGVFSDDEWVHLIATINSSGSPTNFGVYLNGEVSTISTPSPLQDGYPPDTTAPMKIGAKGTTGADNFGGRIGAILIYNRVLTPAEAKQNYEATKSRFTPRITKSGMFASWDAGDPASYPGGTTLKDTANNYDGTFVNNGSGADISFDSANGGSLVFDGSDDYVNITTLPDYSGTARSAIIWFSVDDMDGGIYTPFQSATDQFCVSFGHYELSGTVYAAFRSKNSGSNYTYGVSTTVSDGVWTCWAVTIDASDEIVAVYQNGDSKSLAAGHGFTIKTGTTIGCRLDGSTVQNDLEGKVGSLRLYTKTLSAAEISDNYQKTKGRFGH